MKIRYLVGILVMGITLSSHAQAKAWELYAISGDVTMGKTFILLTWPAKKGVAGFNLYRKTSASGMYLKVPLNLSPLSIMTDCNEIKKIIPPHSEEWKALSRALATPVTKTGKPKPPFIPPEKPEIIPSRGYILFDPCDVASIPDTSQAYERLQSLTHAYWKIAIVMGQVYFDSTVQVGKTYWYEIRGVNEKGVEIGVLDTDVKVRAGTVIPLDPPSAVAAEPGDSKVQITWHDVSNALGYDIYRETLSASPIKINESVFATKCTLNLAGITIPETNCFIDFLRWNGSGYPTTHIVDGNSVDGPLNGTTYQYKIRAYDILGRPGNWSSPLVHATPQDQTPPGVPADINVEPHVDGLETRWLKVTHDVEGHLELGGIQGYWVYRFLTPDTLSDSIRVGGLIPHPIYPGVNFVTFKDTDPILRSDYEVKDYWYRVRCIDNLGNIGPLSSAAGDHLPDTTPPSPPRELSAEGFEGYIALSWKKPEPLPPDLAGYMIYRGICGGDSVCVDSQRNQYKEWECVKKEYRIYPLHTHANIDNPDSTLYEDHKVPDSPICYRYAVKAYDESQNLSDTSNTICQRIREKTPPPPPVISALKARDRAIRVEWVASPVQDLFGFIVERADTSVGPWKQLSDSLDFPKVVRCEDIPATNIWAVDTTFSFLDKTVEPKKIYWYRIKAADYGGNIGKPSAPIETYTFDFTGPSQPTDLSVTQLSDECALKITWNPEYDTLYLGFVVFRESSVDQGYRQISPIIQDNEFIDNTVMAGKTYWYKVQYFSKDGNRSLVSDPKSFTVSP